MCAFRHLGADIAETDDPERLATDLDPDEIGACPLAALHRRVGLRHPPGHGKQQRDRVLGGGDDVAARRVDDQDSFARRRRDVDVVHAYAGPADDAKPPPGLENMSCHARLAAHDKRVEVRNALDQLGLRELAHHSDLACLTQARQAVLRERVGDEYSGQGGAFEALAGRGGEALQ